MFFGEIKKKIKIIKILKNNNIINILIYKNINLKIIIKKFFFRLKKVQFYLVLFFIFSFIFCAIIQAPYFGNNEYSLDISNRV